MKKEYTIRITDWQYDIIHNALSNQYDTYMVKEQEDKAEDVYKTMWKIVNQARKQEEE